MASKGQTLEFSIRQNTSPLIRADKGRFEQILLNLIDNAIKYNRHGGKILLRVNKKEDYLIISVSDEGKGIAKQIMASLFEPYQRSKMNGDTTGLGLGLSLSKMLIELHGGRIQVTSKQGERTRISFSMPLNYTAPKGAQANMKILVIDDDEEIINIIKLTLRVGWPDAEMYSATTGGEGLEMVETQSPDLIILDLGLPDMSGFQVLQGIRQFTDIPVVILTVSSEEVKVVKGLEMGANDYLTKPFRQMELLARLKAASRSLYHPNVSEICQKIKDYNFFPSRHEVEYHGQTIHLTHTESTILAHLLRNQDKSVTYSSIAHMLWSHDYDGASDAIRVYVGKLRKKLEVDPTCPKLIITVPGVGYSLNINNN